MAFCGIRILHETGRLFSKIEVSGEKVSTSDLHITLLHFGDNWPISEVSKSLDAIYKVISETQPFLAKVDKISHFPPFDGSPYPIITKVKSPELMKMRAALAKECDKQKIEFSKIHKDFKPHITLSYSEDKPKDFELNNPIEFMVQEIVLWCGDHGDDRLFITFPLTGPKSKNAMLEQKAGLFEKIAGNPLQDAFKTSYERRKIER